MATILAADDAPVEATFIPAASWQEAMKLAVRSVGELCQRLGLAPEADSDAAADQFPLFVPLEFLSRMQPGNPRDPLLLQVLASAAEAKQLSQTSPSRTELGTHPLVPIELISELTSELDPIELTSELDPIELGGGFDPVGDLQAQPLPGLLQKYQGRVLMMVSGACAIHCRYCFRRHFPYDLLPAGREAWGTVIEHIRQDDSIREVILSGGDPLTVVDAQLTWLIEQLDAIPHVHRLRFHTRLPIVIPQRVTDAWLDALRNCRAAVYVVVHCNHPQEIDSHVLHAMRRLRQAGVQLLNQAVLLAGINDSAEVQIELCQRLVDAQVLPYYLHQLDRVAGGLHFQVSDHCGQQIIAAIRRHLPGYAVPELVREIAGQPSKTPV